MIKDYKINKSFLNNEDILQAIKILKERNNKLKKIEPYYLGTNNDKEDVSVPIGRKLIKSVVGFMFKESAISYAFSDDVDQKLEETIRSIYDENDEENENVELGTDQAKYGVAYEIVYINEEFKVEFNTIPIYQVLPIYSYGIKPKLTAAINYYKIQDIEYVEIYYKKFIAYYTIKEGKVTHNYDQVHFFGDVPLLIYKNNKEQMGDIESIIKLIDAHDKILTNGLSEDGKYADALLILKGATIDGQQLSNIIDKRILELEEDQDAHYLTKPGAYDGRETLRKVVENLIYTMSGIPNLDDKEALSQKSGEALKYLYATFEVMVAGDKQSMFNFGLYKRLRLICNYLNWLWNKEYTVDAIKVNWKRNLPSESTVIIDNVVKLNGILSKETILEQLEKAGVVLDVNQELERLEKETPILEIKENEEYSA